MLPQLLTYEECEKALNWPGAIDALRQCHKLARPQQEICFWVRAMQSF